VRATAELYDKIANTLLMFNADFKNAEERDRRMRAESAAQMSIIPPPEPSFIESVTKTSLALTSALEADDNTEPGVEPVTGRHQAIVLEKLVHEEREEDIL
jgi:hypothetical protein